MLLRITPRLSFSQKPVGMLADLGSVSVDEVPPIFAIPVPLNVELDEIRLGWRSAHLADSGSVCHGDASGGAEQLKRSGQEVATAET